jgi:uncharacterized protein
VLGRLEFEVAGEHVHLFATRALYWPLQDALLIADLHLGKAATFRAAGIALPKGSTATDLRRLGDTLDDCGATRVIVLGDLLHGASRAAHWQEEWRNWRSLRPAVTVQVIGGNHDRALPGIDLGIEFLGMAYELGPFELRHLPRADSRLHVVRGHTHPVVCLPGIAGRWPAFVLGREQTILPAFSLFTGGFPMEMSDGDFAVCVDESITHLPGR